MDKKIEELQALLNAKDTDKIREFIYNAGLEKTCQIIRHFAEKQTAVPEEMFNFVLGMIRNLLSVESHLYTILCKPTRKPYLLRLKSFMTESCPLFTTREKAEAYVQTHKHPEHLEVLDLVLTEKPEYPQIDRKACFYKMMCSGADGVLIDPDQDGSPVCIDLYQTMEVKMPSIPGETEEEQLMTKKAAFYFILFQQERILDDGKVHCFIVETMSKLAEKAQFLMACDKTNHPYVFTSSEGDHAMFVFTDANEANPSVRMPLSTDHNFVPMKVMDILKMVDDKAGICLDPFSLELMIDTAMAADIIRGEKVQ